MYLGEGVQWDASDISLKMPWMRKRSSTHVEGIGGDFAVMDVPISRFQHTCTLGLRPPAARLKGIFPSLLLLISSLRTSLELFDVEQTTVRSGTDGVFADESRGYPGCQ